MREITNVAEFIVLNPGHYELTIVGKPPKIQSGKSSYREWTFRTDGGETFSVRFYPWESKELLLAVEGKDQGDNKVEWDDEAVDGLTIEADLCYVPYPKKDGTEGKKLALRNIKQATPF